MYRARSHPWKKKKKPRKSGVGNKFPSTVRERIQRRDRWRCVKCGEPYESIHHIVPRSHGGRGIDDNGICVCRTCHRWFHTDEKNLNWAYQYKKEVLDVWYQNSVSIAELDNLRNRMMVTPVIYSAETAVQ